jgi:hypothetical protein
MRSVAIVNTGNVDSVLTYVSPVDQVLVGVVATGQSIVANVYKGVNAWLGNGDIPDGEVDGLLAIAGTAPLQLLNIPVLAKQVLYIAFSGTGKGTVQLLFEDSQLT